ncbi:hypothetical protein [Variovorax sp. W2I14]|uniref:hypothetical protein n=1 Tax=Variovorax sp. W2I14 TaxID=3042290 RepID=UPI003D23D900
MFLLEINIAERLRESLPAWEVLGFSTGKGNRDAAALVSVMFAAGALADVKEGAVALAPGWSVLLSVKRGPAAAALLDTAIAKVVERLHNWVPGEAGGRKWGALKLARFSPPEFADGGLIGIELLFSTTGRYFGQE